MMNIKEYCKKFFKDHKATLEDFGSIKKLTWAKERTITHSINYVFDGLYLYISGDYGTAVYRLTWNGDVESVADTNLAYFYEKLSSIEGEKESFNKEEAIKDLAYYIEDCYEEYNMDSEELTDYIQELKKDNENFLKEMENEEDEEEIKDIKDAIECNKVEIKETEEQIKSLYNYYNIEAKDNVKKEIQRYIGYCHSIEEWGRTIENENLIEKLGSIGCNDAWEWIYSIGRSIPVRVEIHHEGLKMASEYLKINK